MKKILAILLVFVMVIGMFAGCKNEDTSSKVQSSTQSSTGPSVFDAGNGSAQSSTTNNTTNNTVNQTHNGDVNINTPSQNGGNKNNSSNVTSGNTGGSSSTSGGINVIPGNNGNSGNTGKNPSSSSSSSSNTSSSTSKPSATPSSMPAALKNLKGIEKYKSQPVDYSNSNNWIDLPQTQSKDVDVFFLYPTGYSGVGADDLSNIDDASMRGAAMISKMGQASVFAQSCNVYVPVYRQLSIAALQKYGNEENLTYCASFDIYGALDYYFQNYNNGKPFILAGHSQGSVWLSVVLQDYMKQHPEYLERMVAAYVIGFSVTKDFLKRNPHLKFATGATDTGVIISYNTEGVGNKNATNMVVEKGAVAINPLNWKTDETKATVKKNLGSLDHATAQIKTPGIADATLDTERGVVICTTVDKSMATPGFGPESYHMYDYSFYYANLMKNVADRIAAFNKK